MEATTDSISQTGVDHTDDSRVSSSADVTRDTPDAVRAPDAPVADRAPEATQAGDASDTGEAEDDSETKLDPEAKGDSETKTDPEAEATGAAAQTPGRSKAGDLEREGEVAADFLETLMDITDLDGDLEVDVDGDRAAVSIVDSDEGSVPRRLIGPKAVVLEALQELTRLAVQAETGDRSRLMLDVGGHRADRKQALIKSAGEVIGAVQASGARREMDPMTAFERKVVHDEVLRAGLRSESEGEEPRRYVVVLPTS